jgi:VanZ family protein
MTTRRLLQFAGWACVIAIAALSLVAPSLRPVTALPHDLEHAAIFAITGLTLGLGYPYRTQFHMSALIVFAGVVEMAQLYAPGRHARVIDFVVDALAACAGVACAAILLRLRARTGETSS